MTGRLHLRAGDVIEECGDTLVFLRLLAGHDPQAGTANDGILRRAGNIRVIRQRRQTEGKLGIFLHVAIKPAGSRNHGAFAGDKGGLRYVGTALVHKQTLFGHVGQVVDVSHMQGRIHLHARIHATQTVGLGGKFNVVPGGETLQLGPALPGNGERTLVAIGLELGRGQRHFGPTAGCFVGVDTCRLERVLVEIEHGGGTVERKTQHLAAGCGVVAGHGRNVGFGVKFLPGVFHDLANRHDGTLAGHHGGGTYLKHLQDVRCIAGTKCRDRTGHRLVVGAFVGRHNFVLGLAGIEILGQVIDPLAIHGSHRMPPLHFGNSMGRQSKASSNCHCSKFKIHEVSSGLNGQSIVNKYVVFATEIRQFAQFLIKRRIRRLAHQGFHPPNRAMLHCGNITALSRYRPMRRR